MSGLSFLIPAGLLALLSLPLIYLFHLRSPTPKTTRVPSLRFWQVSAPRPTEEPRFRRPPLSLDLLLHLGIAALLALALARPVTTAFAGSFGPSSDPIHQIILLDGSTSMASTGDIAGRSRFDDAREAARDRIAGLRAGDAVSVVLFGARISTRSAADPAAVSRLRDEMAEWSAPGGVADLTAALLLAGDLRVPGVENRLLLLTDGAVAADPGAVAALGMAIEDVRFGPPAAGNVAITDLVRRNDPNRPAAAQLLVSVANFASVPLTVTLQLSADGVPVAERDVPFNADERRVELFNLPIEASVAAVRIVPGDSQPIDDIATIQLDGGGIGALNVLIFSDQPDALARAFGALPGARVSVETTDVALAGMGSAGFDLVVYDQVIPASAPVSPALFVAPPDSEWFRSPAMLTEATIVASDPGDPLLDGVDLTGVVLGLTPQYALPEGLTVPVSAADGPLVAYGVDGASGLPVALLASPLDGGNLTERIAFPILIANLADWLAPTPPPVIVRAGEPLIITPNPLTEHVTVVAPGGERTTLTAPPADLGERTVSYTTTGVPGVYVIEEKDGSFDRVATWRVSVNAGHPVESDLRARPGLTDTLAASASANEALDRIERRTELWPLLVGLAVMLALGDWWRSLRGNRRTRGAAQ